MDKPRINHALLEIANTFTDAFILGDYKKCFSYFSETLQSLLPLDVFKLVVSDTLKPIGHFIGKDRMESDKKTRNIIYCHLKYEKLGLCIKCVFYQNKIHGIWLNYNELGT